MWRSCGRRRKRMCVHMRCIQIESSGTHPGYPKIHQNMSTVPSATLAILSCAAVQPEGGRTINGGVSVKSCVSAVQWHTGGLTAEHELHGVIMGLYHAPTLHYDHNEDAC